MDPTGTRDRRVLVVEDDAAIADAVRRRLESEGYRVDVVHDGLDAVRAAAATRYDLVVLDVMLPRLDGTEVCRQVQATVPVPVLMLTARAEETDRLIGLAVGADDYLTKPFSPRELVARVAALLRRVDRATEIAARRGDEATAAVVEVGGLRVDPVQRRASVDGAPVHLTRTEFDLLLQLAERPGAVVGRERLLVQVWDWPDEDRSPARLRAGRAVDSHVKALRRKLGADRIRTVTGVGYALEVPR
ncbi:response regulator transcription factor [Aquipuribacter hungaricus]|uniref:Response regulator transcription factor n=1 Tax=Aquipuribacter hungaricus TaxID=545624 RepID=A0ABV7WB64_9MICO